MKKLFISYSNHTKILERMREDFDRSLEKLTELVDKVENQYKDNNEAIEKFSNDLLEAKREIESWKDERTGMIIDYNGIELTREIIDKLLSRLDFFILNDGLQYPMPGLNLMNTKENFYKIAKEKKFIVNQ